jgi:predicted outer membrane repeat protein
MRYIFHTTTLVTFLLFSLRPSAHTITVNNLSDAVEDDGFCTLFEAITAANDNLSSGTLTGECEAGDVGEDVIVFTGIDSPSSIFTNNTTLPTIMEALEIIGPGRDLLSINAQQENVIFTARAAVKLSGLTITQAYGYNGAGFKMLSEDDLTLSNCAFIDNITYDRDGAALRMIGSSTLNFLTIDNCLFENNQALIYIGGALSINAAPDKSTEVKISNSQFINNQSAGSGGGAIYVGTADTALIHVDLRNSTFTGNSTTGEGGALYFNGFGTSATLNNNSFSQNSARSAGAIFAWNVVFAHIINSTFHQNNAEEYAGAIYAKTQDNSTGNVFIMNSTITQNQVTSGKSSQGGGGIYSRNVNTLIKNSVIAENISTSPGNDCNGSFTSMGYNLIGDSDDCGFISDMGDQLGDGISPIDPMLGDFQLNDGLTESRLPLTNSPLIDAANSVGCTDAYEVKLNHDQNGQFRHQDGSLLGTDICDIGATEVINSDIIFKAIFE